MTESPAIRLQGVSKIYRLYGSQREQLIDVIGLRRLGFGSRKPVKEFKALEDISLEVPRGHRLGVIGRNGAGKSTLLKLICENFAPTTGTVEVKGTVQALLGMGLGFHPDFTGRENVTASLLYSGLSRAEYREAIAQIEEFCELGEFMDQPFKTYSLGMQARLMFAAATAVKPDILVVDEVLGAGDSYFVAKSKIRVQKLVRSGCTMLLVSHSMQQVLELCQEAIWLDQGRVRMQGNAFSVVKAYEEHLYGPIRQITMPGIKSEQSASSSAHAARQEKAPGSKGPSSDGVPQGGQPSPSDERVGPEEFRPQDPDSSPHRPLPSFPSRRWTGPVAFRYEAPGGISRWASEAGLKVCGLEIETERGTGNTLVGMRPACLILHLVAEIDADFDCRYGIALHDLLGNCVTRIFSPRDRFSIRKGDLRRIDVSMDPVRIGPGDYTLGISVLEWTPLEEVNQARRYDLLSRSFTVRVELADSLAALSAAFFHSAEWSFS